MTKSESAITMGAIVLVCITLVVYCLYEANKNNPFDDEENLGI